uniref:Uncharacterized protein n=1 Tax=Megaselia scalaris TaxID=36166 RepID=T1GA06_MEGSC
MVARKLLSWGGGCEIDPKNKYSKLQIAIIKSTTSMDYDAIKYFNDLIEEYPDYVPARKGAAEAHFNLYAYNLTLNCLVEQKIIFKMQLNIWKKKVSAIWLWRLTGYIFYSAAKLPESLAFLKVSGSLVSRETVDTIVTVERKDLFDFAAKFLTFALKLSPNDNNLWYDISLCNYYTGVIFPEKSITKFDMALKSCMKSLQIQPTMWKSWNLLGVLNSTEIIDNLPMAQHCFIKALNLERKSAMVWVNLGSLYLKLTEIKLANEAFLRAQHAEPDYLCAWMGQAMVGELIGVDELEVMDLFRHCTQLNFHIESALGYAHWVCSILANEAKVKKNIYKYAIETMNAKALEKCVDTKERDKIRSNIGNILLKMDKPLEASEYFNSISEATFKSTIGLALAYYRANQHQESYSVYSSALEWLATSEEEKSLILIAIISLKNCPIQAFYSTCALGILHGDIQLSQTILGELLKIKDSEETCHHIAFLTSQVYKAK